MVSSFFGKNKGRQIQELMKMKNHFEQELNSARSKINSKFLPKMEKMTRKDIEKKVLDFKKQLAKGKSPSESEIDDLNSALEILGLKEQINILDKRISELK